MNHRLRKIRPVATIAALSAGVIALCGSLIFTPTPGWEFLNQDRPAAVEVAPPLSPSPSASLSASASPEVSLIAPAPVESPSDAPARPVVDAPWTSTPVAPTKPWTPPAPAPAPGQTQEQAPAPVEQVPAPAAGQTPCPSQITRVGSPVAMCDVAPVPVETVAPPLPAPVSGYGCDAAIAYLQANANPNFRIVCPGYAWGNQAATCLNMPGYCPGDAVIIINVPCAVAYQNEAANSWALWNNPLASIDPYGSSC